MAGRNEDDVRLNRMLKRKKPAVPRPMAHGHQPQQPPERVGLAWFDEPQYLRLLEVAADREQLHDTYAAWLRGAEALIATLPVKPVIVPIEIDALLAWCRERGVPLDGAARSEYVAEYVDAGGRGTTG